MRSTGQPSPRDVNTLVALFKGGHYVEAAAAARAMTLELPEHPLGWKVLGAALKQLGRDADALAPMQKAVALAPENAEAHSNLGATFRELGRPEEALACARRALAIQPGLAGALVNLGNAQTDLGQLSDAEASYRRALEIHPLDVFAHNGLGNVLARLGRCEEAVASCRRALEAKPDYAFAQFNLGVALQALGRFEEAVASYRRALEIKPNFFSAHDNLLFARNYQPDQPAAALLSEARRFGDLVAREARPYTDWPNAPQSDRCLRIGLVSGDLGNHPVGYFLENVLMALVTDIPTRLEFFAYSSHAQVSPVTDRIKACCRGWHSAVGLSDEGLARRIREDGIDILIDLSGHTAHNRLPMFAWKPAPVQVSWLGYLATTGVAAIDYLIADPWTLPESEAVNFTERIWRLPESYLCFTPPEASLPVTPPPALANGHITFGCFNNLTKMNEAVVARWAEILRKVPGSRLFLKTTLLSQKSRRESVAERFASHGIEAGRLRLEGPAPRAALLAAYGQVDIALDPFPYPGITSTIEALWMGVPVLTLAGERFLSRQGVGLLSNAGLPEWIAADAVDYVDRAVAHARDAGNLADVRSALRHQLRGSPLLDARRFGGHLEAALRGMWRRWCERQLENRKT